MSIRTTVTLDDDVVARLKEMSRAKGVPFRSLLNDMLRVGMISTSKVPKEQPFVINAVDMGTFRGGNVDNIAEVIESLEGESWR